MGHGVEVHLVHEGGLCNMPAHAICGRAGASGTCAVHVRYSLPQARTSLKDAEGERDRLAARLKVLEGQLLDTQVGRAFAWS